MRSNGPVTHDWTESDWHQGRQVRTGPESSVKACTCCHLTGAVAQARICASHHVLAHGDWQKKQSFF